MTMCSLCGKEDLCFKCPYCNGLFCSEHRLPESHGCAELHRVKQDARRKIGDSLSTDNNQTRTIPRKRREPARRRKRFSRTEIRDLTIATMLVALVGLALLGRPNGIFGAINLILAYFIPTGQAWIILGIVTIFVSTFMVHELAHKFVAQRYGMWSEFRMLQTGYFLSAMAILFSIPIFGTGVVYTSGGRTIEEDGKSNLAGPLSNFIMALVMLSTALLLSVSWGVVPGGVMLLLTYGIEVNAFIGLFNMIPFQPFDGATVRAWSDRVWLLMLIGLISMLIVAYFVMPLIP